MILGQIALSGGLEGAVVAAAILVAVAVAVAGADDPPRVAETA